MMTVQVLHGNYKAVLDFAMQMNQSCLGCRTWNFMKQITNNQSCLFIRYILN